MTRMFNDAQNEQKGIMIVPLFGISVPGSNVTASINAMNFKIPVSTLPSTAYDSVAMAMF